MPTSVQKITPFLWFNHQAEVDRYWERLSEGGGELAQQCCWLKDRYDVSWQVVPRVLGELLGSPDGARSGRAMRAMLQMKKIDMEALKRAADGQGPA